MDTKNYVNIKTIEEFLSQPVKKWIIHQWLRDELAGKKRTTKTEEIKEDQLGSSNWSQKNLE